MEDVLNKVSRNKRSVVVTLCVINVTQSHIKVKILQVYYCALKLCFCRCDRRYTAALAPF